LRVVAQIGPASNDPSWQLAVGAEPGEKVIIPTTRGRFTAPEPGGGVSRQADGFDRGATLSDGIYTDSAGNVWIYGEVISDDKHPRNP
jgi:hypothetical protein